jgi:membrane-associated phospholipid phosphatase
MAIERGAAAASAGAVNWVDATVMGWVDAHRFPLGDCVARAAMAAGASTAVVAALAFAALAYVVLARRYALGVVVVAATVVAAAASGLLKDLFGRARPPASLALAGAGGLSMPSTDAALSAAAAAALLVALGWYRPSRRPLVGWLLAAGVFTVGLCLVYLCVHWLTEVLAGWALGAAVGCGTAAVFAAVSGRRGHSAPSDSGRHCNWSGHLRTVALRSWSHAMDRAQAVPLAGRRNVPISSAVARFQSPLAVAAGTL